MPTEYIKENMNTTKQYSVYVLKSQNGTCYVGSSQNPNGRFNRHRWETINGINQCLSRFLWDDMDETDNSRNYVIMEIVGTFADRPNAYNCEALTIDAMRDDGEYMVVNQNRPMTLAEPKGYRQRVAMKQWFRNNREAWNAYVLKRTNAKNRISAQTRDFRLMAGRLLDLD